MEDEKDSDRDGEIAALDRQIAIWNKIMIGSGILAAASFITAITILSIAVMEYKYPVKGYVLKDWLPLLLSRMYLSTTCAAMALFFWRLFLRCQKSIHHFHKERKNIATDSPPSSTG
jgi:hypothetical protein